MQTTDATATRGFAGIVGTVRRSLVAVVIISLVLTNIASVVSDRFHDALFGAISSVAAIGGTALAQRLLANSPTAKRAHAAEAATRSLQRKLVEQDTKLRDLGQRHAMLTGKHVELESQHRKALEVNRSSSAKTKALASRTRVRLARAVTRNTGALAAEAVPWVGLAVAVGVTALDVRDACETLKDLNENLAHLNQPLEDTAGVCGVKIPSRSEVTARIADHWRDSVARVSSELGDLTSDIEMPIVRPPSLSEIRNVTCPIVGLLGICK